MLSSAFRSKMRGMGPVAGGRTRAATQVALARAYFGVQAVAGALWWVAVAISDDVRRWTLGATDPVLIVGPDLVLFVGCSAIAAVRRSAWAATANAAWTTVTAIGLGLYGLDDRMAGWGVVAMSVAAVGSFAAMATLQRGSLPLRWFFVGPFSFRVARDRSRRAHLRRSLVQLVLFWSTFFLLVPFVANAAEDRLRLDWPALHHGWIDVGAASLLVLASALGLWSCLAMALHGDGTPLPAETARHLVVVGPYRFVRNPMALAGGVQTASVGLWIGSWWVVGLAGAGALAWNFVIRPEEEADLLARFGPEYEAYERAVRCWVPRLPTSTEP